MRRLDRNIRAAEAAQKWHECYDSRTEDVYQPRCRLVGEALDALGPNPDPDRVDSIIGDHYWTSVLCSECLREVPVVEFGDPEDEASVGLCAQCLDKALRMLQFPEEPQ